MQKLTWVLQNSFERFKDYYLTQDIAGLNDVIVEAVSNTGAALSEEQFAVSIDQYMQKVIEALNNSNNFTDFENQLKRDTNIHFIGELTLNLYGYYLENEL